MAGRKGGEKRGVGKGGMEGREGDSVCIFSLFSSEYPMRSAILHVTAPVFTATCRAYARDL